MPNFDRSRDHDRDRQSECVEVSLVLFHVSRCRTVVPIQYKIGGDSDGRLSGQKCIRSSVFSFELFHDTRVNLDEIVYSAIITLEIKNYPGSFRRSFRAIAQVRKVPESL